MKLKDTTSENTQEKDILEQNNILNVQASSDENYKTTKYNIIMLLTLLCFVSFFLPFVGILGETGSILDVAYSDLGSPLSNTYHCMVFIAVIPLHMITLSDGESLFNRLVLQIFLRKTYNEPSIFRIQICAVISAILVLTFISSPGIFSVQIGAWLIFIFNIGIVFNSLIAKIYYNKLKKVLLLPKFVKICCYILAVIIIALYLLSLG